MEQARVALGKAAATAGKAAAIVGGVAAATGIAVLGVAAGASAAGAGGSGGSNKLPCPRCGRMYATGIFMRQYEKNCSNCQEPLPGRN